jgi:pyridoxal phosphate enzyme (YggS family)
VECFDFVHGVDDLELATELARRATAAGRVLPVLVEVNVSGESSKFGVTPDGLDRLLEAIGALTGVRLAGLMTVGRPVERAEDARADFVRLRELRDRGERVTGQQLPELSMGMSGDYEVAIEEGATLVRVGTALFGLRTATK